MSAEFWQVILLACHEWTNSKSACRFVFNEGISEDYEEY